VAEHAFHDATEKQIEQAVPLMRGHYDQVSFDLPGGFHDCVRRITEDDQKLMPDSSEFPLFELGYLGAREIFLGLVDLSVQLGTHWFVDNFGNAVGTYSVPSVPRTLPPCGGQSKFESSNSTGQSTFLYSSGMMINFRA
jgi:hypothetical protein